MADDTNDEIDNDSGVDKDSSNPSESDLADAKEELLADVGEESKEEVEDSGDTEAQSAADAEEPDELSAAEPDLAEGETELSSSTQEEFEKVVSELDVSADDDEAEISSEASTDLPEDETSDEGESSPDNSVETEDVLTVSSTETDEVISQEEDSSVDAQAVIALKSDSRLYIYGEPEDPMVGVTQNIDRARELMLETMAKSRATTADSLKKARNLNFISGMFLCSALLAAVGFFVFMSIQMSQKIVEIDSLLTAVAKRSIQMTKGIEKFSLMEEQLDKTLVNQEMISEYLAKDEPFRSQINGRIEELRSQLKKDMSARVKRSEGNLSKVLDGVAESSNNNEEAIKQISSMVKNQGDPSKSIRELRSALNGIDKKLNDLYLIEQARVSREISLERTKDTEFEAGGGLE
jgi:hypothetical protein